MPNSEHRPVRSYVLRQGRLTKGQQRGFAQYWPEFGLDYQSQTLDLTKIFANQNPVYLEIGCGNGEALASMALQHPERNYIGIEVHSPGVGHLLLRLAEQNSINARICRHDAIEVLRNMIPDNSLAGVYLFFPDPWHKKRHHKRRIVQADFIELVVQKMQPDGLFHAATDWQNYAEHMLKVLNACPEHFSNSIPGGGFAPRPKVRPLTKFEQRGQRLGHGVWDLIFRRST